ncbi:hypothetical protein APHCRT_1443 [Anaplasma phagocytophilum str. CRT53-1]|uniref:Uncharacterized protein n=1 Tax=Anaplasma phagocytophilum str. CRT53-1 TaxID=1359157 RepID=A0A0F3PKD2_ANAPH|nr:hypothetical protein APHCRT_1443 [Anaplasma phagocytophilum str. CRT53-1]
MMEKCSRLEEVIFPMSFEIYIVIERQIIINAITNNAVVETPVKAEISGDS